jgi:sigma-B regulation protein RsbU (phosphoserine phosphatase)
MKKKGLFSQFGRLFLIFALVSIILSGAMTLFNQTQTYKKNSEKNLKRLTRQLSDLIKGEGDEFINLKHYFLEHSKDLEIPVDYESDLPVARSNFLKYITDHYPGRTFGVDLHFNDLDEEGQRLYATWRFEYWFKVFFDTKNDYDLSYVYFIFADESQDHTMIYMFDPTIIEKKAGKQIYVLGDVVYEDPKIHKYMWEAWDTGKAPEGYDNNKNEYGNLDTFCYPVVIGQEKVGLICADISVLRIDAQIIIAVIRQMIATILALALATAILFYFLKNSIIDRIIRLDGDVAKYSQNKNPAIAKEILESKGTDDEIGSLAEHFSHMIVDLEDYMVNLQKVTAEKERIDAELNVATKIQEDMLPRIFPDRKEFDLYATMTPAKEVGGDFYDFFLVDDDHLALVIADVSGKGVPAALFMAIAKSLIKNRVQMGEEPSEALKNVNEQLCEGNEAELFVTVWLAILDLKTGHVVEANAGHEHPAIKKKDGIYELHKTRHSPAVATMEGMRFRQTEFELEPGDTVFVYTDGVTEATDMNNKLFGEGRLMESLNNHKDEEPADILPSVRKDIDAFVGEAPQFDDITMLGMTYHGPDEEQPI